MAHFLASRERAEAETWGSAIALTTSSSDPEPLAGRLQIAAGAAPGSPRSATRPVDVGVVGGQRVDRLPAARNGEDVPTPSVRWAAIPRPRRRAPKTTAPRPSVTPRYSSPATSGTSRRRGIVRAPMWICGRRWRCGTRARAGGRRRARGRVEATWSGRAQLIESLIRCPSAKTLARGESSIRYSSDAAGLDGLGLEVRVVRAARARRAPRRPRGGEALRKPRVSSTSRPSGCDVDHRGHPVGVGWSRSPRAASAPSGRSARRPPAAARSR